MSVRKAEFICQILGRGKDYFADIFVFPVQWGDRNENITCNNLRDKTNSPQLNLQPSPKVFLWCHSQVQHQYSVSPLSGTVTHLSAAHQLLWCYWITLLTKSLVLANHRPLCSTIQLVDLKWHDWGVSVRHGTWQFTIHFIQTPVSAPKHLCNFLDWPAKDTITTIIISHTVCE